MAGRPTKAGLDYFELDCHMEEKVRLIQAEFGLKGFAVVVKLYQKIYGGYGYYCEWTDDSLLLFMSENGLPSDNKNLISEIVSACIRRNIFSEHLFNKFSILTSEGVQKRYLNATSKRERIELKKEYLLISVPENSINVVINSISDGRNSINDGRNSQRKEDKSRVEESKGKEIKGEESTFTVSNETVCQTRDVRHIVEAWNELGAYGIKTISRISSKSKRYRNLIARLKEYSIDDVLTAIDNIKASDYLRGKNKYGWVITFDWFVLPSNFPKVLEGNYNGNRQQGNYNRQPYNNSRDEQFDRLMEQIRRDAEDDS